MRRSQTATRLLAIAFLTLAGLTTAACSRPTPANPASGETAGEGSESIPPGPYYDDDEAGEPLKEGDEGYPGPRRSPEFFPDAYPEPDGADTSGDEAGEDASGDEASEDAADTSSDESSDG